WCDFWHSWWISALAGGKCWRCDDRLVGWVSWRPLDGSHHLGAGETTGERFHRPLRCPCDHHLSLDSNRGGNCRDYVGHYKSWLETRSDRYNHRIRAPCTDLRNR